MYHIFQRKWLFIDNSSIDSDIASQCRSAIGSFDETVVTVLGRPLGESETIPATHAVFPGRCSEFDSHFSIGGVVQLAGLHNAVRFICCEAFGGRGRSTAEGAADPIRVRMTADMQVDHPASSALSYAYADEVIKQALQLISAAGANVLLSYRALDEATRFQLSVAGIVAVSAACLSHFIHS